MLRSIFKKRLAWKKMPSLTLPCMGCSKLTVLFFVTAALCLPVKGIAQTVTLSGKQVSLQQTFDEIKKQTNYTVLFNPDLINAKTTVSLNARSQPLEAFMKMLISKLQNQSLNYTIVASTIVVFPKEVFPQLDSITRTGAVVSQPPALDISGVVYDDKTGMSLPGATVMAVNSGRGTQTDERGMFSLKKVPEVDNISITSIGYKKVIMPAQKIGMSGFIKMEVATNELDQAVVRAYGVTTQRFSTGNITRISGAEIARQPVLNPLLALQGRVPGMLITPTSGHASSPVKVEIRGRNSLSPNYLSDPLYVIDGVPVSVLDINQIRYSANPNVSMGNIQGGFSVTGGQSSLFGLNTRDIASIEVLKDAAATASYGSRAANGVILITTKKGEPGKTRLTVDVTQGILNTTRPRHFLNTQQYLAMRREALLNDGIKATIANAPDLKLWDTTRYTNWQKEVLGTGSQTMVAVSLTGGTQLATYRLSGSYNRQVAPLNKSGADQTGSINSSFTLRSPNQKLNVIVTTGFRFSRVDAINETAGAITLPPNAPPVFDSKGNLNYADWNAANIGGQYKFGYLLRPNVISTNDFRSSLNISYEIVKGLSIRASGGLTNTFGNNSWLQPIISNNPQNKSTGSAYFGTTRNTNWIVEPQLSYNRLIGKGTFLLQLGGTLQNTHTNGVTSLGLLYDNDNLIRSISNAPFKQIVETDGKYKYAGTFMLLNYIWNDKYIIDLSARRDGSSRFGPGRQFGNFGSVAAAWVLSKETWMQRILPAWVSFLKLRSSYGITGGDGAIKDYEYMSQWSAQYQSEPSMRYAYGGVQPFIPLHAVNQDYHWEANKKFEAAFQAGFLEDRVDFLLVHFQNRSGDQITQLPTPVYSGFNQVTANWAAVIQNSGWDGSVRINLINKKELAWSVGFNISVAKNKLLSYTGFELSPYAGTYKIGASLSAQYLLHFVGVDPRTGEYSFADHNKDGKINTDFSTAPGTGSDDRYITLNPDPEYFGGATTGFRYKGFDLNLSFDYRKQLGLNPYAAGGLGIMKNVPLEALNDHWRKPGDNARYARFSTLDAGGGNMSLSDGVYTNASFMRLNNISLRWSLPDKAAKKAGMAGCSVYFNVQNIYTFTNYIGRDPEIQDLSSLPSPRNFTFGLSVNL